MKKNSFFLLITIINLTYSLSQNYDQLIMTPPPFENNQSRNYPTNDSTYKFMQDEYVFVPTPVDQNYYKQLKQQNDAYVINNPNFIDKGEVVVPNDFANVLNNTIGNIVQNNVNGLEDIANTRDPDKMQTFFNLQEADYNKYFDAINKMEYQKVFKSLNPMDEQTIYNKMANTNIDYGSLLNSTSVMINLPQEKKEIENSYANFFNEMYIISYIVIRIIQLIWQKNLR
jgi:hypothetical protein